MGQQPSRTSPAPGTCPASRLGGALLSHFIAGVLIVGGLAACSNTPPVPSGPSGPAPATSSPLSTTITDVAAGPTTPAGPTSPAQAGATQSVELSASSTPQLPGTGLIQTVFIIMMENHNWSEIMGSSSAPYINEVLLPQASHAEQYYNPPGNHPSEPNYLWLEAGTNFGITDDNNPSANHLSTTAHLVTLLNSKGISWKAYQEGISGTKCPLVSSGLYAPKHNPMVYFDDVTGSNNPGSPYCIAHERPYAELATDLRNDSVARYNFITPDLCDDMHNSAGCTTSDSIENGDTWLSSEVPQIINSQSYRDGGALFITWDEGEGGSDGPIGMIVLSPYAKGGGYSNAVHYTHSSTLRMLEEIFGVTPLLGDAASANDLADLFYKK
jgi:hypothetical protein